MADVWIPSPMRDLTGGAEMVEVPGGTLMGVIIALDQRFPGLRERLCSGMALRAGLSAVIDNQVARMGLWEVVREDSEVHFLPAISGG